MFCLLNIRMTINGTPVSQLSNAKLVTADGAKKVDINSPCFLFAESQYCENGGQCSLDANQQPYCE